ncbi:chromosome alignment-maintaining phosphoprotein 1-like [Scleropages formosus]|uniref:chromosome alignment-maintaining phosphoprotein 1-like n=1 Tax=Scleropages formosus TaxID=113540 RepID=UPI000634720A|nr:chromosome alignment-maintaining phosphoprotein 1 [Scleropages formosus]
MDIKKQAINTSVVGRHLQCAFCSYQCKSNGTYQIHVGTFHPVHCEEMDLGRLGKIIFYQRSAKLFHCQTCFFTGKTFARVYDHVIVSHCFAGKSKRSEEGEPKDYLSDSNDSKDVLDHNEEEKLGISHNEQFDSVAVDAEYSEAPAKFTSLDSAKTEEEEGTDEDFRYSVSPSHTLKRKREVGSDEEPTLDDDDFPDYSPSKEEHEGARPESRADKAELSKYFRRNGGRYYCNICNWRVKMKGFMLHHVSKKHDIPKPYVCKECNKSFLLESILNSHISMFHKQGIYQCPYCSFKTNFLRGIRRHLNHCSSSRGEGEVSDSDEPLDDQD